MERKLTRLSRGYAAALRRYLKQGPRASLQPARGLGRKAMALGLETLDLARIHEQALVSLSRSGVRKGIRKRVERFFVEAIAPIETTQRGDRESKVLSNRPNDTVDLAASKRCLKQGIVQRKAAQKALKKSGEHFTRLLKESRQLQKHLRHKTRRIMVAQEDERRRISRELHDEIAQTLLGLNVRLLTLKKGSTVNTEDLKKEIASTQRLVEESVRSINRFAGELRHPSATVKRLARPVTRRRYGAELPVPAGVVNRIVKAKSKPERQQKEPANAAHEPTLVSPAGVSFPVVAMAASAGGLKALSVILGGLPADFPAAIAIVMHLSPEHKSLLAEILDCRTHLEVKQAQAGDILRPSSVFVAPPNHHMFVVKGGRLELSSSASEKVHHARPSAEPLFASVADVYKKNAIGVVLTGGDGDGSLGVQIIKEKGGRVIAQDCPTSQDFSMPETSIKTGDVDFILPLNEIAPKLMELVGAGRG